MASSSSAVPLAKTRKGLSLEDLTALVKAIRDTEGSILENSLTQLHRCLSSVPELEVSFRTGGVGPPDYATIFAHFSALLDGHSSKVSSHARVVMEATLAALSSTQVQTFRLTPPAAAAATVSEEIQPLLPLPPPPPPFAMPHLASGEFVGNIVRSNSLGQDRENKWGSWELGWRTGSSGDVAGSAEHAEAVPDEEEDLRQTEADLLQSIQTEHLEGCREVKEAPPPGSDVKWIAMLLAAALPLLEQALPRDQDGVGVLPHQHRMRMCQSNQAAVWGGRQVYITNKACDRCMDQIYDRIYYHCSKGCDVDFCKQCHEELQSVLDQFFTGGLQRCSPEELEQAAEHTIERMLWTVHTVDEFAAQILHRHPEDRLAIAQQLANEWPPELLGRLVQAVVDVCNAKMLYNSTRGAITTSVRSVGPGLMDFVQEGCSIYHDNSFWESVGLLQFLYICNFLPQPGRSLDEPQPARVPTTSFILNGINKCKPEVEWHEFQQWLERDPSQRGSCGLPDVLRVPEFAALKNKGFRAWVTHSNLLPISFRRRCLISDVREQFRIMSAIGAQPLFLKIRREHEALVAAVTEAFTGPGTEDPMELCSPLGPLGPLGVRGVPAEPPDDSGEAAEPLGEGGIPADGEVTPTARAALLRTLGRVVQAACSGAAVRINDALTPTNANRGEESPTGQGAAATGEATTGQSSSSTSPFFGGQLTGSGGATSSSAPKRTNPSTTCKSDESSEVLPWEAVSCKRLRRPLQVAFCGEDGQGPGVRREFFQVAFRAFLSQLFVQTSSRLYWFSDADKPEGFWACGALLGQAVLYDVLVPTVFPAVVFELLLREMLSPLATQRLGLHHLFTVSPEEANSLTQVLEYQGEDIQDLFGDLGWERTGTLDGCLLSQATKADFVSAYVQWRLYGRFFQQIGSFCRGFAAVLGCSLLIQRMVDAEQLERIVCGAEAPVDVAALKRRASLQNWKEEDQEYLETFWSILERCSEAKKKQFVLFVTASDRAPLRGWEELRLTVQKNGSGDERLPTAYTCFSLLLLPKYTSAEALERNLLLAVTNSEGFGLA